MSHIWTSSLGHHRRSRFLIVYLFHNAVLHKLHAISQNPLLFRWHNWRFYRVLIILIEMDASYLRSPLGVGKLDRCVMLGVISSSEEAFLKFLMILQRMKISAVVRILFYGPLHCWNSGCICRRCKNERMAAHVWNRRCLLRLHKLIISARLRI